VKAGLPWVSLRTKIAFPVAVTMLLLGLGSASFVRRTIQASVQEELHRRSLSQVSELALRATQKALVEDQVGLEQVLRNVTAHGDVAYVVIISASGYVVAHSFPAGVPDGLVGIFETPRRSVEDVVSFRSEQGDIQDYVAQMIDGRLGTVHMGVAQGRVQQLAWERGRTVLMVIAAGAVLAAILAWLVTHLATVPLRRLTQAATQVGEGDLEVRSGVRSFDEVGDMAARFDEMVERLAADQERLRLAHQMMIRTERLAMVGKVSSGVAHEIGNPLHAARQFVEALQENPEQSERYTALLEEALRRIDKVIDQMLGFSRERRLDPRPTDINAVVTRATDFLSYDKRIRDTALEVTLGSDLPHVQVDPDAMGQVVANLLVNALDAVEGGGHIRVSTAAHVNGGPRPEVLISVDDDGPGVPQELTEHIFDPFFTTKEAGRGTGLGLSVSQELLSVQGGRIEFKNVAGGGASFEVWLPAMETR
jgi:signal transduction histidine kinase